MKENGVAGNDDHVTACPIPTQLLKPCALSVTQVLKLFNPPGAVLPFGCIIN